MSRAFVKEPDGGETPEPLPERPISPHPNFVTPEGLQLIDSHLTEVRDKMNAAQTAGDRAAMAQICGAMTAASRAIGLSARTRAIQPMAPCLTSRRWRAR